MMSLVSYNRHANRVWIYGQRIHHGPFGIFGGVLLLTFGPSYLKVVGGVLLSWGLTDIHDFSEWFRLGA